MRRAYGEDPGVVLQAIVGADWADEREERVGSEIVLCRLRSVRCPDSHWEVGVGGRTYLSTYCVQKKLRSSRGVAIAAEARARTARPESMVNAGSNVAARRCSSGVEEADDDDAAAAVPSKWTAYAFLYTSPSPSTSLHRTLIPFPNPRSSSPCIASSVHTSSALSYGVSTPQTSAAWSLSAAICLPGMQVSNSNKTCPKFKAREYDDGPRERRKELSNGSWRAFGSVAPRPQTSFGYLADQTDGAIPTRC